jgi:hypothetical protein
MDEQQRKLADGLVSRLKPAWSLDGYDRLCHNGKHVLTLDWVAGHDVDTFGLRNHIVDLLNGVKP